MSRELKPIDGFPEEVKKAVKEYIDETQKPLADLLDLVEKSVSITAGQNKQIETKFNLTSADIEALVVKIPTLCSFIQAKINESSLDHVIGTIIVESKVTSNIDKYLGQRGDAKERLRRAERDEESNLIALAVRKHIYKSLTDLVERADKVYEGLKKIIDARNREFGYDRKT